MTAAERDGPALVWPAGLPAYRVRFARCADGVTVRVVERGEPGAPPVVFIPGWGCPAYTFHWSAEAVATAGFRAIIPELKGCGLSDKPTERGGYTMAAMTRHTLAVLDAIEVERAPLVGLSMGGGLAVQVSLAAPERASRLALFSPSGFGWIPGRLFGPLAHLHGLLRFVPAGFRRGVVAALLRAVYGDDRRIRREDVGQFDAPLATPGAIEALALLLHEYDWRAYDSATIARIPVPFLLCVGTRDRVVWVRDLDRLRRALPPHATMLVVEGAGHAVNLERPEVISPALVRFLREAEAAGDAVGAGR